MGDRTWESNRPNPTSASAVDHLPLFRRIRIAEHLLVVTEDQLRRQRQQVAEAERQWRRAWTQLEQAKLSSRVAIERCGEIPVAERQLAWTEQRLIWAEGQQGWCERRLIAMHADLDRLRQ
jgi:hypothetical protein